MRKGILALLCISGISLALSGCATTTSSEASREPKTAASVRTYQPGPKSVTVGIGAGGGFHEHCEDEWEVGDVVNFSFTSSKPLVFNVHYHDAQEVKHYSIEDVLVDDFSGNFTVRNENIHCGMWLNNSDSFVKLTYEVGVAKE